jgi:aminobenzoyl-glutamate utilization protein B
MNENEIIYLSDEIWGYAETGFEEEKSAEAMVKVLTNNGFEVTQGIDGMPTAYVGVYGSGRPVVDLLAEYDALFGMNQTADVPEFQPITNAEDTGHGCGHELLGAGSIAAAILCKEYLQRTKKQGTVRIVGCPAEESGSSKAYLARDGFFQNTDVALTWHPGTINQVCTGSSQSCLGLFFKFHGVSAHAAAAPFLGRSALDACELMNVGVNYLREHIEPTECIHYAYANAGGKAPNVVQSEAAVKYFIRSSTNEKCLVLKERVINCAKGSALMTGTTMDIVFDEGLSNTISNFALEKILLDAFKKEYHGDYTQEELAYAQCFKNTFDTEKIKDTVSPHVADRQRLMENINGRPINDYIVENIPNDNCTMGSTDVGDVSWVVPTEQINTACFSLGADAHSWQWVAQGKSKIAHKGMLLAGRVLAAAAQDMIENPEKLEAVKDEFKKRLYDRQYHCLIPDDIKPHISSAE